MKLAIMQPYFFPYIGYFQLINSVELFIIYDNIKYTKKGWINRNRMLQDGRDVLFSLPLKADSDALDIVRRELAADFDGEKMLRQFANAYRRAPYFQQTMPLLENVLRHKERNLFNYLHYGLVACCQHLGITTPMLVSSQIDIDHGLKSQDKVLALCSAQQASNYINTIGGIELYSVPAFEQQGIHLQFMRSRPFEYAQLGGSFVPALSIIDVLMFNPIDLIQERLIHGFDLI